jgi:putative phosphoribosyl transferase
MPPGPAGYAEGMTACSPAGPFPDRANAGMLLAGEIARQLSDSSEMPHDPGAVPLVLALPRGGVPVAVPIAERIGAELGLVLVRKIGAPGHAELGVGAIAENGPAVFDQSNLDYLGLTPEDLADAVERERAELARRIRRYRGERSAPHATGRTVVVVDDGIATGVTARAALRWLREQRPATLILAVPVCARQAREAIAADADVVVCLNSPREFRAVGAWYDDFRQLSDDDVERAIDGYGLPPAD